LSIVLPKNPIGIDPADAMDNATGRAVFPAPRGTAVDMTGIRRDVPPAARGRGFGAAAIARGGSADKNP
jgi:hypothetical protein